MAGDQNREGGPKKGIATSGFNKGLYKDTPPSLQPEGSYTWALNSINESSDGDQGFLINEIGNYECAELDTTRFAVIGSIYIQEDDFIVFLAPIVPELEGHGKIVRLTNCKVKTIMYSNCLNFKIHKQIQGVQRIRNGCEINIYFTDNYNDVRAFNISSLRDYLIEGADESDIEAGLDPTIWDCESFKLWPEYSVPCINFEGFTESGELPAGSYQFAVQYLDSDFNSTNWTAITQPIPIYADPSSNISFDIKGSEVGDNTNKSIRLRISDIDSSFSFVKIAVIPSVLGTGISSSQIYTTDPIAIAGTEDILTEITTIGTPSDETISLSEVTIPRKTYEKAKTIAQIKNRLVLGNVSSNEIKQDKFQKAAFDIKVNYSTRTLSTEDADKDSVQSGSYYFDYRSYMRDEIYALAIVWVFKDGTESYAYHIPGREKDKYSNGSAAPSSGDPNNPTIPGYDPAAVGKAEHNRAPATNGWDSSVIVSGSDYADTNDINTHHYANNTIDNTNDNAIERWEVYNTAVRTSPLLVDEETEVITTYGEMGYYECRNSRYPATLDCDGKPVYPYSKKTSSSSSIQNLIDNAFNQFENGQSSGYYDDPILGEPILSYEMGKIRHHRMPDTTLETHQYGDLSIYRGQMHAFGLNAPYQDRTGTDPKIVTLGLKLSNVKPPIEYADKVQGFRIVRAKQDLKDKTVIDKGIAYYNHFAFKSWHGKDVPDSSSFQFCNWMQQGNYFNKHITSFACARGGYGTVKTTKYLRDADQYEWGYHSIADYAVYNHKYEHYIEINSNFASNYGVTGGGVGNTTDDVTQCTNCSYEHRAAVYELAERPRFGKPAKVNAFVTMLIQNNYKDHWLDMDPSYHASTRVKKPRAQQDWLEIGNGYPSAAWGWSHPPGPAPSPSDILSSNEGVNVGYQTDVIIYPNTNLSYHGPMSKFAKISGAEYIKIERVLIGYTQNLVCNTACCHNTVGGGDTLSQDPYAHSLTGQVDPFGPPGDQVDNTNPENQADNPGGSGIGLASQERDDNGTTYIYSMATYHHSGVPYSHIREGVASMYCHTELAKPSGEACEAGGGNGNSPRDAWGSKYNIYEYPLCNIRLEDYTKINAFENVFVDGFGDSPFDNNTAMECFPFSMKTKENSDGTQAWIRMPYPGNNDGYNRFFALGMNNVNHEYTNKGPFQFPLDSSWSLTTCDRLQDGQTVSPNMHRDSNKRGRITTYYISFKKNSYNAYGNLAELVYVPTHNCVFKLDQDNPNEPLETVPFFGGDSFISRFAFKHTQFNGRCARMVYGGDHRGKADPDCTEYTHHWSQLGNADCLIVPGFGYGSGNNINIVFEQYNQISTGTTTEKRAGRVQKRNGIFNHISWYWTESYINTELRTGQQEAGKWFYPYHFEGSAPYGTLSFVDEPGYMNTGHQGDPYPPTADDTDETELPQSYTMNPDYNKTNTETTYFPLPQQFDFCSDCKESHPYRIAYSEQSFQEEQQDLFKYFLTNNYRDIPSNRGEVWNVLEYQDSLYIQSEESMWKVDPSRNIVTTDEQSVYIGTGDFFSSEVQELAESDTGYLGSQSQWALTINMRGITWPDANHRKIFVIDKQPNDLSAVGIKNWTQENMEIGIYTQYEEIYGQKFPLIDNPANPAGAGYLSAIDGRHHRIIFTKRDYLLKEPFTTTDPADPYYQVIKIGKNSGLWELRGEGEDCQCVVDPELQEINPSSYSVSPGFDITGQPICLHTYNIEDTNYAIERPCLYTIVGDGQTCVPCKEEELTRDDLISIPLNDGTLWEGLLHEIFECKSWTLSYSNMANSWVSWHSYMPNFYLSSKDFFMSGINKIKAPLPMNAPISRAEPLSIWKHSLNEDHSNYQSYYGCIYPHVIETVTTESPLKPNTFENIHFLTDVSKYNVESKEYYDDRYVTFNSGYLFNSYQITDTLNFVVKDANVPTMTEVSVTENYNSCILDRKERVWGLNGFRDMAIDRNIPNPPSLFTNEWDNIASDYYIDRVINPLAVDQDKNWFEQARMVDKYLGIRLFFSNLEDPGRHKIATNYLFGSSQESVR